MIALIEHWLREMHRAHKDPKQAEDEQGGWRRHVYLTRFSRILSVMLPFPDPLCPGRPRHLFFETVRAMGALVFWTHMVLAHFADVQGIYPGWDFGYAFRKIP